MDRRRFLELAGAACGGVLMAGCGSKSTEAPSTGTASPPKLAGDARGKVFVGRGADPAKSLEAAVAAAGGLGFVKSGSTVVLKPNAAWARTAEQAATTDPRVVAAMVRMCRAAGASKVIVFEHTIDRPAEMVLAQTGIAKAASEAGAEIVLGSAESDYEVVQIPDGRKMKSDAVAKALLSADVVINLPKAKRHSSTELTLGLKNLMGVTWNRQAWHTGPDLHQYIADYATVVPINMTVVDASRILLTNGPKGPGETKDPQEVIVSLDPVAADAYACSLFGMKPSDVAHIGLAAELGLGEADPANLTVQRV